MFDFKTLLENIFPDNSFGGIDPEGDLADLFEGLGDDYQAAYDEIIALAKIRDPRLTENLIDLEREYGLVNDLVLSDAVRRNFLRHIKYKLPDTASWEHVQNALIDAGFTNLIVTPNNPVVDPADVTHGGFTGTELIVNGTLYTSQSPAYYMAAGSDIAFAGHSRGFAGYYLSEDKVEKTYAVPTDITAHWTWRYVFWVGGAASGWPASPVVAVALVDTQRITQLRNLILRYKPVFTWGTLVIESPHIIAGTVSGGAVYRSKNYGVTWELPGIGQLGSETDVRSIIKPTSNVYLAGTYPNGKIFRSTDLADTWTDLGQQASQTGIESLAAVENGICLAGTITGGRILRSEDYGETWTDLGQRGAETGVYSLLYLGNGICLAGTYPNGRIYRSTNYGENWNFIGQLGSESYVYSLLYLGNGICLAGTGTGGKIFRSTDYGLTWEDLGQLGSAARVYSLVYLREGLCLAGTGTTTGKIYKSTDYGVTWEDKGNPGAQQSIFSLAYLGNGICVGGTGNGGKIVRSEDHGDNWTDLGQLGSESIIASLASTV
jgi:photosystem II stability/assembly factor-like uncharacterized protein